MQLSKQLASKMSAALMALTTVIVPSMAADIGTVTSDTGLNLRSEASTDAAVLAPLDYGTQMCSAPRTTAPGTRLHITA